MELILIFESNGPGAYPSGTPYGALVYGLATGLTLKYQTSINNKSINTLAL
jgi:hypothetical protein